jgi:aspartokinase
MIVPKFSGTSVESAAAIARAAAIGMLPVSRQINRPKRVVSLQRRQAPGGFV